MSNRKLARNMKIILVVSALIFIVGSIYIKNYGEKSNVFVDLFPGYSRDGQPMQEYYPTGELRASGVRKNHQKDGKWVYFNKDGSLALEEFYEEGELVESVEHNIIVEEEDTANL